MDLYCDGGCIGNNPSPVGGTWAWVAVDQDRSVRSNSGIVTPTSIGLPRVTNNYTELLAAVEALESVPNGWEGTLYTDSQVTANRLRRRKQKFTGIPDDLRERCMRQRYRLMRFEVVILRGHPTADELALGMDRTGRLVSRWNVWCDEECNRLAAGFHASYGLPVASGK